MHWQGSFVLGRVTDDGSGGVMLTVSIGTDMALGRYNKTLNHGVCYKV